ncbi:hypothetical protein LCGC14_2431200 [marine sediment metagenome]|uniref:Uncharacterized protein n=1 Tax=marine sediment metagenome TaxID=412755 RepID=A0A0F9C985_9ZZZZ
MKLNFTIETDELYGEDGIDFESLLSDSLRREVIKTCKKDLASEEFKRFSMLASDTVVAGIKLKLEGFLSEEIALTEGWGKPTFVGSIEDLIKKRFDDVLLRPVDGSGKTLRGCTSDNKTWIEWRIEKTLKNDIEQTLNNVGRTIRISTEEYIDAKFIEMKESTLKKQVDAAFISILKQGETKGG